MSELLGFRDSIFHSTLSFDASQSIYELLECSMHGSSEESTYQRWIHKVPTREREADEYGVVRTRLIAIVRVACHSGQMQLSGWEVEKGPNRV